MSGMDWDRDRTCRGACPRLPDDCIPSYRLSGSSREWLNHRESTIYSSIDNRASGDFSLVMDQATLRPSSGYHHRREDSQATMVDVDRNELRRIATAMSRRDSIAKDKAIAVAFRPPAVDPNSPDFDLERWLGDFSHALRSQGITARQTGVAYKNLGVTGSGSAVRVQETVGSVLLAPLRMGEWLGFGWRGRHSKQILRVSDGLVESGELLLVLGRPGSGCSTLLKTLCGELHGLKMTKGSSIHYDGIPQHRIRKELRGNAVYNHEVDKHFPHLTVGQTLEFAASVRTPYQRSGDMSPTEYARYIAQVVMAVFGLSHTRDTQVGNESVRGISDGERRRLSIAEMVLSGSPFCAWVNGTHGLDADEALRFVQSMRLAADVTGKAHAVALHQSSEVMYDQFDKVTVLYEGRQIFFGPVDKARSFFERMGWYCAPRRTTADFLTAVTDPRAREALPGMESQVPRTPAEFEAYWRGSPEYDELTRFLDAYETEHLIDRRRRNSTLERRDGQTRKLQSRYTSPRSPYAASVPEQVLACTRRAYQRLWNDKSATLTALFMQLALGFVVGSVYYGTRDATVSFYARGSVLFVSVLLNALSTVSEIGNLYTQREVVAKHASYGFYHPFAEAAACLAVDVPVKLVSLAVFNVALYFLAGLRREPDSFFLYFLVTYISAFVMSAVFRTLAAITRTATHAMALAGVMIVAFVVYTGFAIPVPSMKVWFSWIRWANPMYYAFEMLIANEFHGRNFTCSKVVPHYTHWKAKSWVCSEPGAVKGKRGMDGDAFIAANYDYYYDHMWRNVGILLGFLVVFTVAYLVLSELRAITTNTASSLVFQRSHVPAQLRHEEMDTERWPRDQEAEPAPCMERPQTHGADTKAVSFLGDVFAWRDVVYEVDKCNEKRRLVDHVSGWVKPGTMTALMGGSPGDRTTLLDVLALRTSTGVVTGDMLVNGRPLDASFQSRVGYVQKQDVHLATATVRESLRFSAMLRQPRQIRRRDKDAYVEEVIRMLDMDDYADAVVGVPGQGLTAGQRKLLTIGVELAARPSLVLFLDEPTSGLDAQGAQAVVALLRRLADAGQAILCTLCQPSAALFEQFDQLLFLAPGGRTAYFGDIGANSWSLLDYFQAMGAQRRCEDDENPAEYVLELVNGGVNRMGQDWHYVWKMSAERLEAEQELDQLRGGRRRLGRPESQGSRVPASASASASEFAMPFWSQLWAVTHRIFQQYWRMPGYVYAKLGLGAGAGLFIGFSFYQADRTIASVQNLIFAVFLLTTIFSILVLQMQPLFVAQRLLYEVRERPSKTYSWKVFLIANLLVEVPYQTVTGVLVFGSFYYPIVGTAQGAERQALALLFAVQLSLYAAAFALRTVAALPSAQTAARAATFLTILMSVLFSGVLQTPDALPGFWLFMYRASPFTYWIGGAAATLLHGRSVACSAAETAVFDAPRGMTCGEYMMPMVRRGLGRLENPHATTDCRFCALEYADQYLAQHKMYWGERWRDYGLVWAYVGIDVVVAAVLYYLCRVRRRPRWWRWSR